MKHAALLIATATAVATACSGAHTAPRSAADVADSAFVRDHYTKRQYKIPMRDGTHLFTIVYVPRDAALTNRYPIVVQRTPFSVAPYGLDAYPRTLGPDRFMLREEYIFVYQDVRGRYASEGTFENVRPLAPTAVDEATDTYDTIDWLLAHVPDNNGKVGQWGISYAGFYAALGAVSHHPALVASSPQAPVTDLFFEDFHHNGALTQAYFYAYPYFGVPRPGPTTANWWRPEPAALRAQHLRGHRGRLHPGHRARVDGRQRAQRDRGAGTALAVP
jgi:uncharacterized protein